VLENEPKPKSYFRFAYRKKPGTGFFEVPISELLGRRGIRATEKLMGLLLNLVAVNMVLFGVRDFLVAG